MLSIYIYMYVTCILYTFLTWYIYTLILNPFSIKLLTLSICCEMYFNHNRTNSYYYPFCIVFWIIELKLQFWNSVQTKPIFHTNTTKHTLKITFLGNAYLICFIMYFFYTARCCCCIKNSKVSNNKTAKYLYMYIIKWLNVAIFATQ